MILQVKQKSKQSGFPNKDFRCILQEYLKILSFMGERNQSCLLVLEFIQPA